MLMEESDWVRLTVPVNPLTLDRLMLTVAERPCMIVIELGRAESVKSTILTAMLVE